MLEPQSPFVKLGTPKGQSNPYNEYGSSMSSIQKASQKRLFCPAKDLPRSVCKLVCWTSARPQQKLQQNHLPQFWQWWSLNSTPFFSNLYSHPLWMAFLSSIHLLHFQTTAYTNKLRSLGNNKQHWQSDNHFESHLTSFASTVAFHENLLQIFFLLEVGLLTKMRALRNFDVRRRIPNLLKK